MKKSFLAVVFVSGVLTAGAYADAVIRVGDSFELKVGGVPPTEMTSVNGTYSVDGGGGLNLPYIGKLTVANMTSNQIQALVERTYIERGIYTHPTITISTAGIQRFVSVGGHVRAPQRVVYTPDMTLLSAINAAGDFDEFAKQTAVKLIRGSKVQILNVKAIKNDPSLDVPVLPGDQIQVPESMF